MNLGSLPTSRLTPAVDARQENRPPGLDVDPEAGYTSLLRTLDRTLLRVPPRGVTVEAIPDKSQQIEA